MRSNNHWKLRQTLLVTGFILTFMGVGPGLTQSLRHQPDRLFYTLNDSDVVDIEYHTVHNIVIDNRDIFDPGINGEDDWKERWLGRMANLLHLKTKSRVVRHELLFEPGDDVELIRLRESERLLRQSGLFMDAEIRVYPIPDQPGRVEIRVITQDHWSLEFPMSYKHSDRSGYLNVVDANFLGVGHRFRVETSYNQDAQVNWSGAFDYVFRNYRGSHYDFEVNWDRSNSKRTLHRLKLDRPFFSPLAKWASSIELSLTKDYFLEPAEPDTTVEKSFSIYRQDAWLGRALGLRWKNPLLKFDDRIVAGVRLYSLYHQDNPDVTETTNRQYEDRVTLLGSVGLSSQNYYLDYYFNRLGSKEDIPEGRRLTYTTGVEIGDYDTRHYHAFDYLIARNIPYVGYVASAFSVNGFRLDERWVQSAIEATVDYVTPVRHHGDWKYRFFTRFHMRQGYHRFEDELIYLNYQSGLRAIDGRDALGSRRVVVNFETHFYAPYEYRRTRFGLNLLMDWGMIGGNGYGSLSKSKLYHSYGLSFRLRSRSWYKGSLELGAAITPDDPGPDQMGYRIWFTTKTALKFLDFSLPRPHLFEFGG